MAALREYDQMRKSLAEPIEACGPENRELAIQVIKKARKAGRNSLTEIEAKQVFAAYGMPVTKTELAKSEDEAVKSCKIDRFPGGDEDRFSRHSS